MLLAYGLGTARRGRWPQLLGEHLSPPKLLLEEALVCVADMTRTPIASRSCSANAFDAPPAGWAQHAHHDELAQWLQEKAEQTD